MKLSPSSQSFREETFKGTFRVLYTDTLDKVFESIYEHLPDAPKPLNVDYVKFHIYTLQQEDEKAGNKIPTYLEWILSLYLQRYSETPNKVPLEVLRPPTVKRFV